MLARKGDFVFRSLDFRRVKRNCRSQHLCEAGASIIARSVLLYGEGDVTSPPTDAIRVSARSLVNVMGGVMSGVCSSPVATTTRLR